MGISDVLVVVELAEDNEKDGLGDKYLMYYAFFMGLGSFIFACHVAINVLYISRLFFAPKVNNFNAWVETTKKREKAQFKHGLVSRVSFSSLGNKVSPLSEKEKEAAEKKAVEQMSVSDKMKIQLKFLSHANNVRLADSRIQRTMALTALFLFEDLPMGVLNLMIVFDQECSSSNSTNTIVILALLVSMASEYSSASSRGTHKECASTQSIGNDVRDTFFLSWDMYFLFLPDRFR